jgi:hypothetical protein
MYFSEEIYKAMEYGYKFKVIRGYIFEKEYIFKDYVNYLYEWKVQSEKNSPNYTISKLLLNSLYGRFGMNEKATQHAFINEDESFEYYRKFEVIDDKFLQKFIIKFKKLSTSTKGKKAIIAPISILNPLIRI